MDEPKQPEPEPEKPGRFPGLIKASATIALLIAALFAVSSASYIQKTISFDPHASGAMIWMAIVYAVACIVSLSIAGVLSSTR
jgi:hypothetical protein